MNTTDPEDVFGRCLDARYVPFGFLAVPHGLWRRLLLDWDDWDDCDQGATSPPAAAQGDSIGRPLCTL